VDLVLPVSPEDYSAQAPAGATTADALEDDAKRYRTTSPAEARLVPTVPR